MDWLLDYYNWRIVVQYTDPFLRGLGNTLIAAGASLVLAVLLGVPLALGRMSARALLWRPVAGYVQFVRATPLLVQIYLVYYGLPALIPASKGWSELALGIVALTLHHGAYVSEIVRAGIASVPRGQIEGGKAVGMSYLQRLRYIVLPQAFANTLPPLVGQAAVLIKDSSLLSLITVFELVAAGVLMNSERIVPNESFLTIAVGYLLIYGVMLLISQGVRLWLAGPAWNTR
ncbi:amino acid ABC transporter permease [Bordetella genomosp. 1]|uniref:Amino acid ABC transporter permease n=1 Tax=Bordetella genomosp. 1 TaxID=1395607 RepID=A0A261S7X8_9BORD|nr:amino acid ABC transporter permease [Bordetella genomosp. 1]MDQ8030968.1 amino acid ABC transporter permease [Bordetella sp.]OZI33107.1 amino acid ABC transporter permease [Bordetella genomosp. 1]